MSTLEGPQTVQQELFPVCEKPAVLPQPHGGAIWDRTGRGNPKEDRKPKLGVGRPQSVTEHESDLKLWDDRSYEQKPSEALEDWAKRNTKGPTKKRPRPAQRIVLLYLVSRVRYSPRDPAYLYCWPKLKTIVADTGLPERTVQWAIATLIKRGLLLTEAKYWSNRRRRGTGYLICPGPVMAKKPLQDTKMGSPKLLHLAQTETLAPGSTETLAPKEQRNRLNRKDYSAKAHKSAKAKGKAERRNIALIRAQDHLRVDEFLSKVQCDAGVKKRFRGGEMMPFLMDRDKYHITAPLYRDYLIYSKWYDVHGGENDAKPLDHFRRKLESAMNECRNHNRPGRSGMIERCLASLAEKKCFDNRAIQAVFDNPAKCAYVMDGYTNWDYLTGPQLTGLLMNDAGLR